MQNKNYGFHEHVHCGGSLTFHHVDKKQIRLKSGRVITQERDYFCCDKCGQIVQCTLFPSYEEMVVNHMFPKDMHFVPFSEYKRLMIKYGKWKNES